MKKLLLAGLFVLIPFYSLADQWKAHEKKDEMRGTSTYTAELRSVNSMELSLPKEGDANLVVMMVSQDAKNILGAALVLTNGSLACQSSEKCFISAKFGGGPVKEYSVTPAGSAGSALSINDFNSFAKEFNFSKSAFIEVPIYREGLAQFKFSPEPLDFDSK